MSDSISIPIIEGKFQIHKMDMKGGWSYVLLPGVHGKTGLPFGWFVVKGTIDDYAIKQYKLWPTQDGKLFLPIKLAIRKSIKKQEGDWVDVILYEDQSALEIPEEFIICLKESPKAYHFFNTISETSKKQFVDYVYAVKSRSAQAERIAKSLEKMELGLKYHEKIE
jgi:hypothetical protein